MITALAALFTRLLTLTGAVDLGIGLVRGNTVMITGGAITAAAGIILILLTERRP
jgi:hypothetical protein